MTFPKLPMSSSVHAYDFHLPEHLIAQHPRPRGTSRLLVVDRRRGNWSERTVADLPLLLSDGDLIVANDTRVYPARLIGRRDPSGGAAECFLLERQTEDEWLALVHPGQKLKPGSQLLFEDVTGTSDVRIRAEILERHFFGRRLVRLRAEGADSLDQAIDRLGHVPLPPYIKREDGFEDRERYQTVYARTRGSVAAPTAGLHFDVPLIARLEAAGIGWATVTHHVGFGTFKPVRVESVEEHTVDPERYDIPIATAERITRARSHGHRIVAVGTTTTRALESAAGTDGTVTAGPGITNLFIHPGHEFRAVDALLTNFHLPKSSLLMLVSALAGAELTLAAYRHAVAEEFRFYSYGDAMLIL
jgi:S-adenosylmethionine:tRNA ribosyltransferase-isomerase